MKFDARLFKLLPYCYLSKKKKKIIAVLLCYYIHSTLCMVQHNQRM